MRRLTGAVLLAAGGVLAVIALGGAVLIVDWLRHPGVSGWSGSSSRSSGWSWCCA